MKIMEIGKYTTYYVSTDGPEWTEYRTDETGTHWEVAMGESWEPVDEAFSLYHELRTTFLDYLQSKST